MSTNGLQPKNRPANFTLPATIRPPVTLIFITMRVSSLIKDYARLKDAELNLKAEEIILSLTGNVNFPETNPTLAEFTTVKEAFSTAWGNSLDSGRSSIALKNQAKLDLVNSMRFLAINIESIAKGDKAKLLTSGFDLAADGDNPQELTPPTSFVVSDGVNPGELKCIAKGARNAISYIHEYTVGEITSESVWVSRPSTSREYVFKGLKSGDRVYCRVIAVGRRGQEVYSIVQSRVVQ